jgi:hypothetical protein
MTKKISNIDQLREDALRTIERLDNGDIVAEDASTKSKLYDNVMNSLKLQIFYSKIKEERPNIPFLNTCPVIEGNLVDKPIKELEKK